MARRAGPAHLVGDLARELEHLPVEKEEAGEPELGDERDLFAEAGVGTTAQAGGRGAVALLERAPADLGQLHGRRIGTVGEVGVAIAKLVRQVELEPFGELDGRPNGVLVLGPAGGSLRRRGKDELLVSAPLGLAAFERDVVLHGDEHVLQARTARMVRMYVS